MKKQIILVFAILFSLLTFAQDTKAGKSKEKSSEQMAQARTKKWTKVLSLTTEQVPQVKAAILVKINKMNEIKTKHAGDKKEMHKQLKAVKAEADAKLKEILSQEQYDLYIKTKEENRKKAEKAQTPDIEENDDL